MDNYALIMNQKVEQLIDGTSRFENCQYIVDFVEDSGLNSFIGDARFFYSNIFRWPGTLSTDVGNFKVGEEKDKIKIGGQKFLRKGNYKFYITDMDRIIFGIGKIAFHQYWSSDLETSVNPAEIDRYIIKYNTRTGRPIAFYKAIYFSIGLPFARISFPDNFKELIEKF